MSAQIQPENSVRILLTNGLVTFVSPEDEADVNKYTWSFSASGYAYSATLKRPLHQYIWYLRTGSYPIMPNRIDHKNSVDILNNTWNNLRIATPAQNAANTKLSMTNTSGCKGVTWNEGGKKWQVRIAQKYFGVFDDIDEAVKAAEKSYAEKDKEFANCAKYEGNLNRSRQFDLERKRNPKMSFEEFRNIFAAPPTVDTIQDTVRNENIASKLRTLKEKNEKLWESIQEQKLPYRQIPLGGHFSDGQFSIVDNIHYDEINKISWSLTSDGYAVGTTPMPDRKTWKLHKYIFCELMKNIATDSNQTIDHKEENSLFNVGINLRFATPSEQSANRGLTNLNTSGYKGVHRSSTGWKSVITYDHTNIELGHYSKLEQAALVYDLAFKHIYPEIKKTNYELQGATEAIEFYQSKLNIADLHEINMCLLRHHSPSREKYLTFLTNTIDDYIKLWIDQSTTVSEQEQHFETVGVRSISSNKFAAFMMVEGKGMGLGTYNSLKSACIVRDLAAFLSPGQSYDTNYKKRRDKHILEFRQKRVDDNEIDEILNDLEKTQNCKKRGSDSKELISKILVELKRLRDNDEL